VVDRIQALEAAGALTGVMDERGKFIAISGEEMAAVAAFLRQRGRVAIAELAARSGGRAGGGHGKRGFGVAPLPAGANIPAGPSPASIPPPLPPPPIPPPLHPQGELIDLEPRAAAVAAAGAGGGEALLDFDAVLGDAAAPVAAH
jgi:hypothetical protein